MVNFDDALNELLDALQDYFNKHGIAKKTEAIADAMADVCYARNKLVKIYRVREQPAASEEE